MKYFHTLAIMTLLVTACHHKDDPDPEPQIADRTVLVYMAAENNLTPFLKNEFKEMRQGSKAISDKNNLIVYVDAADANTPPYLFRFNNGLITDSVSMEESNTADPTVIYKVLSTAIEKYPAREYGLVLWGHASGWNVSKDSIEYTSALGARGSQGRHKSYGVDNGRNDTWSASGKSINMVSLAKVLERTGQKLKFIFADCCQFMCIESAYELRNTCDYIIGSAAEIPGDGAPYETVVPAMFSQNATFYKQVAEAYLAQESYGYREPLAVVKTSELEALAAETHNALQTFATQAVSEENPYLDLNGLIYYQGSNYGTHHYMYDMNDIMLCFASNDVYTRWKDVFLRAVVYRTPTFGLGGQWMTEPVANNIDFNSFTLDDTHYGGVSMFVPQYPTANYINQNADIRKMSWYYAAGLAEFGW